MELKLVLVFLLLFVRLEVQVLLIVTVDIIYLIYFGVAYLKISSKLR